MIGGIQPFLPLVQNDGGRVAEKAAGVQRVSTVTAWISSS
jgi:hypothetical protein